MTSLLQALLDGLSIGANYALLAAGVAIISAVLRFVSFSFGGQVVFVAFVMAVLESVLPLWAALLVALIVGVLLSVLLVPVAYWRAARLGPTTLVMISFALGLGIQAVTVLVFGDAPRPFPGPDWSSRVVVLGDLRVSFISIVIVTVATAILLLLDLVLRRTRVGVAIRGAAEDPEVAQLLGIKPRVITIAAFVVSGVISAVVAYLWFVKAGSVQARVGFDLSLGAFVAVVVGGLTSLRGSIAGGVLLGVATALLTTLLPGDFGGYARALLFLVVVLVLIARPQGLFGRQWQESR